jgi:hypothetical protein
MKTTLVAFAALSLTAVLQLFFHHRKRTVRAADRLLRIDRQLE